MKDKDVPKTRINSKNKGSRAKLELAKILTKRFGLPFARVGVTSGARVKNTMLPDNAIGVMTGDIIAPPGFRFSIESKSVNINIDFLDSSAQFDKWLLQATTDAKSIEQIPLLAWKRNRKGWIVAVPSRAFVCTGMQFPAYYARYRDWLIFKLETLLAIHSPCFWFVPISKKEESE